MYVKKYFDKEIWKEVILNSPFKEKYQLFISNYGQVKRITLETAYEKILTQGITEGYPSFNIAVMTKMSEKESLYFDEIRKNITPLTKEVKILKAEIKALEEKNALFYELTKKLEETESLLFTIKTNYLKNYRQKEQKRKKTFSNLVHRLVAIYFIEQPSEQHNLVGHLDYNKLNNHHSNLKWMTRTENSEHQKSSPYVIKSKANAFNNPNGPKRTKLTVSQVMIIKKRLNESVPMSKLAKRYNITEMQISRIKRGENWGSIPAAL